jgi:uncharacterized Zn finger protein (UPF0148 family)
MGQQQRELDRLEELAGQARVFARKTGALIDCPNCGEDEVWAEDDDADREAYKEAMRAHKRGEFGKTVEEARAAMQKALSAFVCENCEE